MHQGGYIAFAIVFAIACAYLSNWQFTRNESRERQLALIAANYDAAPAELTDLVGTDGSFDPDDQWRCHVRSGGLTILPLPGGISRGS